MGRYRAGEINQDELQSYWQNTCSGYGACNMMGTTNTMACIIEAVGLSLPGNATTDAMSAQMSRLDDED